MDFSKKELIVAYGQLVWEVVDLELKKFSEELIFSYFGLEDLDLIIEGIVDEIINTMITTSDYKLMSHIEKLRNNLISYNELMG